MGKKNIFEFPIRSAATARGKKRKWCSVWKWKWWWYHYQPHATLTVLPCISSPDASLLLHVLVWRFRRGGVLMNGGRVLWTRIASGESMVLVLLQNPTVTPHLGKLLPWLRLVLLFFPLATLTGSPSFLTWLTPYGAATTSPLVRFSFLIANYII